MPYIYMLSDFPAIILPLQHSVVQVVQGLH